MANLCVASAIAFTACGPTGNDKLVSIAVEPADATLTYSGTPLTLDYTAIGTYGDGHTAPLPDAVFTLDTQGLRLGNITAKTFAATGGAAGKGGVLAELDTVVGNTTVAVLIHTVNVGPGVPANGADNFPDTPPTTTNSPTIDYPLDHAVMPTSVKAPDTQWEGPNVDGDLYRVRITAGQFATVDTILAAGPSFKLDSQLAEVDWRMLAMSAGTDPLVINVAHWNQASGASGGVPVSVQMIDADVTGAIYYWNLGQGQMERIDGAGRGPAIPKPPMQPSTGSRCVACHTVSRDGRFLSGSLWGGGLQGGVFDMSNPAVQTADPAPTIAPVVEGSTYTQLFSTFNQDATRLMINVGTALQVLDPTTGQPVATQGTPLPTQAAHPSWSPDGSTVVFVNNITAGGTPAAWAVDYDRGDLQAIAVTAADTFSAPSSLVAAASAPPGYAAPSWPTFSPDSQWIVYGAGTNSRGASGTTPYPGSLFLINKNGGAAIRLDTLCGGLQLCYLPNFSPYDVNGYFWLVFYSFREYGNTTAGTKGKVQRQMWVAAIDKAKLAQGIDVSAVPYWVPDQDVTTNNMSAFWALPPPLQ